ncbi:MAG: hypothetical protein ACKOYN_11410 [Planctomycetota bacterium]
MYTTNPYATNPCGTNNGTCTFGTTNNPAFGWNPATANTTGVNGAFLGGGIPDCCGVTGFAGAWGNPFNAWNSTNYGFGAWNGANAFNANWNALFNGTPNLNQQNYGAPSFGNPSFGNPSFATPNYGTPSFATPNYGAASYGAQPNNPAFVGAPYGVGFGATAFGGNAFNATNGWNAPLPGWLTPSGFVPANAVALRTGFTAPFLGNGNSFNTLPGFNGGAAAAFANAQGGAVPGWFTPAQGFVAPNGSGTVGTAAGTTIGSTTGTTAGLSAQPTTGTPDYACSGTSAECGGNPNIKVRAVA